MSQPAFLLQTSPFRIPTDDGKTILEHFGMAANGVAQLSVAQMTAPQGWGEPPQTPDFDEVTLVLSGRKRVEVDGHVLDLHAGQSILVRAGHTVRYSNPFTEPCHYVAICLPAFTLATAHRHEVGEDG